MSQYPPSSALTETLTTQPPPSHHLHASSDPLPGAGAPNAPAPAADYSADVTNDARVWQSGRNERDDLGAGSDARAVVAGGQHRAGGGATAAGSSDDQPRTTERGGAADVPEGKAKVTDRIIGKTQKVTGKMTGNAALHEKGELREAGGKAAVQSQARTPHD